jgi:hypothetical protein
MLTAKYDAYGPPEILPVRTVPRPTVRAGHVPVRALGVEQAGRYRTLNVYA